MHWERGSKYRYKSYAFDAYNIEVKLDKVLEMHITFEFVFCSCSM